MGKPPSWVSGQPLGGDFRTQAVPTEDAVALLAGCMDRFLGIRDNRSTVIMPSRRR